MAFEIVFGEYCAAVLDHLNRHGAVCLWIYTVQGHSADSYSRDTGVKSCAMCRHIDTVCQAAHNNQVRNH